MDDKGIEQCIDPSFEVHPDMQWLDDIILKAGIAFIDDKGSAHAAAVLDPLIDKAIEILERKP